MLNRVNNFKIVFIGSVEVVYVYMVSAYSYSRNCLNLTRILMRFSGRS